MCQRQEKQHDAVEQNIASEKDGDPNVEEDAERVSEGVAGPDPTNMGLQENPTLRVEKLEAGENGHVETLPQSPEER
jgi:hypothetical protein